MTTRKRVLGSAVAVMAMGSAWGMPAALADDGGRPFRLDLSGANEFNMAGLPSNVHGDADRGTMELRLNPGQEEACWTVTSLTLTAGENLPTAAHIHRGPATGAGGIVVHLFGSGGTGPAPTSYPTGTTCVPAPRALLLEILQEPEAFYANLHNSTHPGGVVRAQLG